MGKDPSFPFYASDWLGSTKRAMMTLAQQGAYVNLLCHQWNDPTHSLPNDPDALGALSGMGEGWLKGGSTMVEACFQLVAETGRIRNMRLYELRLEREEWKQKSSAGGVQSGKKRRENAEKLRQLDDAKGGSTKRQPPLNTPSPSPSPSSSSSSTPSSRKKSKPKKFTKPTIADITAYCLSRKNRIDANQFYDHYEANGWKVGKNTMKDWKACIRTWEKNNIQRGDNGRDDSTAVLKRLQEPFEELPR